MIEKGRNVLELVEGIVNVKFIVTIFVIFLIFSPGLLVILYFKPDLFMELDILKLTVLSGLYASAFMSPLVLINTGLFYPAISRSSDQRREIDKNLDKMIKDANEQLIDLRAERTELEAFLSTKSEKKNYAAVLGKIIRLEAVHAEALALRQKNDKVHQNFLDSGFLGVSLPFAAGGMMTFTSIIIFQQYLTKTKDLRLFLVLMASNTLIYAAIQLFLFKDISLWKRMCGVLGIAIVIIVIVNIMFAHN